MTLEELNKAYKEIILPHARSAEYFKENRQMGYVSIQAYNPICGDKFEISMNNKNEILTDSSFYGHGCSLSRASTAIMLSLINGLKISDSLILCDSFMKMIEHPFNNQSEHTELNILAALKHQEGRESCITLPWIALADHLKSTK